jgi:hypothetical protein
MNYFNNKIYSNDISYQTLQNFIMICVIIQLIT